MRAGGSLVEVRIPWTEEPGGSSPWGGGESDKAEATCLARRQETSSRGEERNSAERNQGRGQLLKGYRSPTTHRGPQQCENAKEFTEVQAKETALCVCQVRGPSRQDVLTIPAESKLAGSSACLHLLLL